ncbi:MAG: hypothetical protein HZC22_19425 [Rhodocyclales bacterium]|nr:hypothetical protein [Rhodocyclales bacterium]
MLLIVFAAIQIVGHLVNLPAVFSLLAPLIFALAAGGLVAVDMIDRACGPLAGLRCWLAPANSPDDFIPRPLGAATPPPRLLGA